MLVDNFSERLELSLDCPNLRVFQCNGKEGPLSGDPNQRGLLVRQKIHSAENIPTSCMGIVKHDECYYYGEDGPQMELPFRELLGDNVEFAELRWRILLTFSTPWS